MTTEDKKQLQQAAEHLRAVTEKYGVNSPQYIEAKKQHADLCKKFGF